MRVIDVGVVCEVDDKMVQVEPLSCEAIWSVMHWIAMWCAVSILVRPAAQNGSKNQEESDIVGPVDAVRLVLASLIDQS